MVYAFAVGDGLGGIWTTCWGVFVFSFTLALVVVFVVGAAEDGAAAGVDACCCEDGSGFGREGWSAWVMREDVKRMVLTELIGEFESVS